MTFDGHAQNRATSKLKAIYFRGLIVKFQGIVQGEDVTHIVHLHIVSIVLFLMKNKCTRANL